MQFSHPFLCIVLKPDLQRATSKLMIDKASLLVWTIFHVPINDLCLSSPSQVSPSLLLDEPLQTYSQNYFLFLLILLASCYNSDPLAHSSSVGKESAYKAGDHLHYRRPKFNPWIRNIPGSGEANGKPLQYSCLENPMDRGVRRATEHVDARIGHDSVTKPPPPTHSIPLLLTLVKVHPSLVFQFNFLPDGEPFLPQIRAYYMYIVIVIPHIPFLSCTNQSFH